MGFRTRAIFSKTGDMRFVSHLDLVRMFQRAARRAALPVTVTKGFSPRLKISILRALKLGAESASEEAVFYLDGAVRPEEFTRSMNACLPDGVKIVRAEELQ